MAEGRMTEPPIIVTAVRNGIDESEHRGHVAISAPDGALVASVGNARFPTYVRSAAKPFQAAAVLDVLDAAGVALDDPALAIACASHTGSARHQSETSRVLALAGLDPDALQCPPDFPSDRDALFAQRVPSALAHNCSGKHAGFLLAQVQLGVDPAGYLDPRSELQRRIRARIEVAMDAPALGPGVDGCGAPAWVLPLRGLATGFARLAAHTDDQLGRVREAMTAYPVLVGGEDTVDTTLMRADTRVVAKRGAEAVLAAGFTSDGAPPLGVAVKIADGGARAVVPVIAAVLSALGAKVPEELTAPAVLGGGRPHGLLRAEAPVTELLR